MNTEPMTDGYLSVFGASIMQPIVTLWEELSQRKVATPTEVQTNMFENGLSISIIVLTMSMVESYLNRARHIMTLRESHTPPENREPILSFFENNFPSVELTKKLSELYAIRDVILHNHIWDALIKDDGNGLKFAEPPTLVKSLYGDNKFRRILDEKTLCSKTLGLNLFPTKIWREDAKKVIQVAYEILYHVQSVDTSYCVVSWMLVKFMNKNMKFSEFILRISGEYRDRKLSIAELAPED